ncbi:MAG: MBL fold metallo-hydrolase [Methanocellales archaeon]|nr:MBL fold metallo-hydrolase [Methanocellales archaeon]
MNRLIDLGVLPIRIKGFRGYKPHFSVLFRFGRQRVFGVDTSYSPNVEQFLLITHAHSDHHGNSAMLSPKSVASEKTAKALEIRYKRRFTGMTFKTGEVIDIDSVKVHTYTTGHTIGATAFSWENEVGARILATGDVKDISRLPKCEVLITEANYGDPLNPQCRFEDDTEGFKAAIREGVAFGAYPFGKAQRAIELLRHFGYHDEVEMEHESLELTRQLMEGTGPLVCLGENGGKMGIVPPWYLHRLPDRLDKFVLTGRGCRPHKRIRISDHLDFNGLVKMVEKCSPEMTIVYHPTGDMPAKFVRYLNENGFTAISIDEITNVVFA